MPFAKVTELKPTINSPYLTGARRLLAWRLLLAVITVAGLALLGGFWSRQAHHAHIARAIPLALVPTYAPLGCTWRILLLTIVTVLACVFPAPGPKYGAKIPLTFSAALLALLILPPELALVPLLAAGIGVIAALTDHARRSALLDRLLLLGAAQTVTGLVLSRVYLQSPANLPTAQLVELLRAGSATAALMAALVLSGFSFFAAISERADGESLAAVPQLAGLEVASAFSGAGAGFHAAAENDPSQTSRRGIAWTNEATVTLLGGACVVVLSAFYARINPFLSTGFVVAAFAVLALVGRALVDGKLAGTQLEALRGITQQAAIGKSPNPERILTDFLEQCSRLILFDRAAVWLLSTEEIMLEKHVEYSGIRNKPLTFAPAVRRSGEELVGRMAELVRPKPILVSDTRCHPRHRDRLLSGEAKQILGPSSAMLLPMLAAGELVGVVEFERRSLSPYVDDERARIQGLAILVAISLANIRQHTDVMQQAVTDGLTGLYNKRQILKTLADETSRAKRYSKPLSVMMLDLDGFKKFNDTYGHMQGDILLQRLSELIKAAIRNTDIAGRYGGEEFVVVMPETGRDSAWVTAERIRARIEAENFPVIVNYEAAIGLQQPTEESQPHEVIVRKTISIGIATYPSDALDNSALLARADEALYAAKNTGRNKVVLADRPTESQPKLMLAGDSEQAA